MNRIQRMSLLIGGCFLVWSCGGSSETPGSAAPKEGGGAESADSTGEALKNPRSLPSQSPVPGSGEDNLVKPLSVPSEDEIVPLLNPIPPSLSEGKVLPEEPAAFRRQTVAALKTDIPKDELLTMIDVVLLIDPQDFEMREARAKILLRQGLVEDAAQDLRLCCEGGRSSCCR